jgi:hypothetical protein
MSIREKQLKVLAKRLKGYDYTHSEYDGKLEYHVGFAIEEAINSIGDCLEEILEMDVKQLDKEL